MGWAKPNSAQPASESNFILASSVSIASVDAVLSIEKEASSVRTGARASFVSTPINAG